MSTEEAELPLLVLQLALQLLKERIGDVAGHQGLTMLQLQIIGQKSSDLCPVLIRQFMAKGSLYHIRLLIVLQDQRIGHLTGRFDRAGHIGLLFRFYLKTGTVSKQVSILAALIALTVLHIDGVHDQSDAVPYIL